MDKEKKEYNDPFDGEYIGNIWGWKFSLYGLVFIVALVSLMTYRHYQVGNWDMEKTPRPQEQISEPDSLKTKKIQ